MKAALLSELITSKNVLIQSLAIYAAVSLVIGISMQSPIAMVACIGAMTPFMMTFTFCALDGMNGWERFRATLPVSRTAIVASRYASILLATVAMVLTVWCIGMLLSAALPALFPDWAVSAAFAQEASDPAVFLFAGMMGSGLMLAVAAFVLPFAMRFGMTKSIRIIPVFAVMLIPVSIFFVQQVPDMARLAADVSLWVDQHVALASALFVAIVLAIYAASCAVTAALYRKKEV
ncbi:MAG: ABC-2 transporter permease [Slackia sp.]